MFFSKRKQFRLHASIDDTLWIFKDITDNNYESIFENKILNWLKVMHLKYGVGFTCYCWYNAWYQFSLDMATSKYSKEFEDNADWLKFGFHGYGFGSENRDRTYDLEGTLIDDFSLVNKELAKITSKRNIDDTLRLSSFLGNREELTQLAKLKLIKNLLCADKEDRQNYYLSDEQQNQLNKEGIFYDRENGITFYQTNIRIESIENFSKVEQIIIDLKQRKLPVVAFTHEWAFLENFHKITIDFENVIKTVIN